MGGRWGCPVVPWSIYRGRLGILMVLTGSLCTEQMKYRNSYCDQEQYQVLTRAFLVPPADSSTLIHE